MTEKYEIHGFVKRKVVDDWQKLETPIPVPTDNYEIIKLMLKQAGINYFIYEVRRNPKWVEHSPSAISTDKNPSGTK